MPVDGTRDLYDPASWAELEAVDSDGWTPPDGGDLSDQSARRLRDVLDRAPNDPERMIYVAGQAPSTPVAVEVENREIVFRATAEGDGRVPWETGLLEGIPTWYMPGVKHGALANHKRSFAAIDELLREGGTELLSRDRPAVRGPGEIFDIREDDPEERVDVYPNHAELVAAALADLPETTEDPTEPPIRVTVSHGDLAYASAPVMVGHYQGDPIVSAEWALDRQLDGRLSHRHRLGRYPGPIGSSEVVLAGRSDAKPGGAIVIGLGRVGELSRGDLATTVTEGVVGYALKLAEDRPESDLEEIELVSLLIGSSEAGLTIEESIEAILLAVRAVNARLRSDSAAKSRLRIGSLHFVELYQDLAVQALHSLRRIAHKNPAYQAGSELGPLEAGRKRVFVQPDRRWWLRLVIHEEKVPATTPSEIGEGDAQPRPMIDQLKFSMLGSRARAESRPLEINRKLVDGMIDDAMHRLQDDQEVGETLFELLLPNHLKLSAAEQRHLILVVDRKSARYPWELLVDRAQLDPSLDDSELHKAAIARHAGLIRQLATDRFRSNVVSTTDSTALVIGDPPSHLFELPGAQKEAKAVVKKLEEAGYEVSNKANSDRPSTARVLKDLLTRDYKIVHLAGHGEFDANDKNRSGMVIGEERFLTPAVINQMRQVPELVFINCCHLGYVQAPDGSRTTRDRDVPFHELAANLGEQLIEMGVRAIVAAGWPVDDGAALEFANTFYDEMLSGEKFGLAVWKARMKTFEEHRSSNTWGAYQCYGDPDYQLFERYRGRGSRTEFPLVARDELVMELDNCVSDARAGGSGRPDKIEGFERHPRFPSAWRDSAAIATAFGRAYAEIGNWDAAMRHYRRAVDLEDGTVTLKDIEQLGNAESRCNELEQVLVGRDRLRRLVDLGETGERWSLVGAASKRLAIVSEGAKRRDAIDDTIAAYKTAHELRLGRSGEVDTYPLLNYLAARVVRNDKDDKLEDLAELLLKAEQVAAARLAARPDFWNAILPIDIQLIRWLADGSLSQDARRQEIIDGFLAGRKRGASPREFQSVIDHFRFLHAARGETLLTRGRKKVGEQARADTTALGQILSVLERENKKGAEKS